MDVIEILKAYGVPENLLAALENMYSKSKAKITSPDGETDYFEILAWVLQLQNMLIIVLDYALRRH